MNIGNLLWWAIYILCAVLLQEQVSFFDALAPGFLIALQEKKPGQIFCLFILFCLIQEGTGSLRFGTSLLWFGGQIIFYAINSRFFVTNNIVAVSLLSVWLAMYRGALLWFMIVIQDLTVDYSSILDSCINQAVFFPLVWLLASALRPKVQKNGN